MWSHEIATDDYDASPFKRAKKLMAFWNGIIVLRHIEQTSPGGGHWRTELEWGLGLARRRDNQPKIKDTQTMPRAHGVRLIHSIRYVSGFVRVFPLDGDSVSRVKSSDLYATNSHTKTEAPLFGTHIRTYIVKASGVIISNNEWVKKNSNNSGSFVGGIEAPHR